MVDVVGSSIPMLVAVEGSGTVLSLAITQDNLFDRLPLIMLDCDIGCGHQIIPDSLKSSFKRV